MIDVRPIPRCLWKEIGTGVCAKEATHGTLGVTVVLIRGRTAMTRAALRIGETPYYLCKYHAGKARRDGWRGVKPLVPR